MSRRTLLLVLFGCLIALFLQSRVIHDVDLFWQVKLGQLALRRGELVHSDPFTATHGGEPVPTVAWLSQVLYAVVHGAGSWRLLHQVNALVMAGGLLLASLTVRGRAAPVVADMLALGLGVLVAVPHCDVRPHSFAVLCFAAVCLLSEAEIRPWRKLALAAAVLLLWQNLHPSVLLGAVAIGVRAGAGWLRWLRDRRAERPWVPSALATLAVLCTAATPMGLGVFATSRVNTQISRELGISEWLTAWDPVAWQAGAWLVWLAMGVSLVLVVWARRQVRLEDLATFLALGTLGLLVYRLSLFWAVAMVPVWLRWLEAVWSAESADRPAAVPVGRRLATILAVGGLLCAVSIPRLARWKLFDDQLPLAAIDQLRRFGVRGTIYNYREWGGPLIWEGYPNWKVTIDGRLYLFPPEQWDRYGQIATGDVPVAQVEEWYRPEAFFLRPTHDHGLIRLLRQSNEWEGAYADAHAVVFLRRR